MTLASPPLPPLPAISFYELHTGTDAPSPPAPPPIPTVFSALAPVIKTVPPLIMTLTDPPFAPLEASVSQY
ncbi:hypothetical protein [Methanimicrococcus blatticola]|uniref:hypothetical protein n=1 Tax=Methanimicrococcus blatticola TaxID=91560 RepID=UPI001061E8E2|nr:hypothetical protein [Methanimicrococcus blatticola]MBZ3936440.1 hypothetical protein [Methanimicrococcus blatticola]MCC2508225.1 hypothetical protein [Methanimicrococcus blatticola]